MFGWGSFEVEWVVACGDQRLTQPTATTIDYYRALISDVHLFYEKTATSQVSSKRFSKIKMFGMKQTEAALNGRIIRVGIVGSIGVVNI